MGLWCRCEEQIDLLVGELSVVSTLRSDLKTRMAKYSWLLGGLGTRMEELICCWFQAPREVSGWICVSRVVDEE